MNRHLFLVLSFTAALFASCVHTEVDINSGLSGTVKDFDTSEPLGNCVLLLTPGNRSITTSSNGTFDFGVVEMGEYIIQPFLDGYEQKEIKVRLEASKPLNVDILLKKATAPIVKTSEASDVKDRSARIMGEIESTGGIELIEVGFYYGDTEQCQQKTIADIDGKSVYAKISGLLPEKRYYYKVYARNLIGESCGEIRSLMTLERQLPDVITLDATNLSVNSARLEAKIDPDIEGVENCGFYYGTNTSNMVKVGAIIGSQFYCDIVDLTPRSTYYFKAYIADKKNEKVGELVSFTTEMLQYNGKGYVDLGLPSGVKWAAINMGAKNEQEAGGYYAWGETSSKTTFDIDNYKHCVATSSSQSGQTTTITYEFSKYNSDDKIKRLELIDDAAHVQWGGEWRMPTFDDFKELRDKCTWTWSNNGSVKGYKVVGPNGSYIFIPYAGYYGQYIDGEVYHTDGTYYWSSDLSSSTGSGICLKITDSKVSLVNWLRYYGFLIRPVFQ